MSQPKADSHLFDRLRPEQLEEFVAYFEERADKVSAEVINCVKNENFTGASMKAGELELCRTLVKKGTMAIEARRRDNDE